jgi:hypothetical protein
MQEIETGLKAALMLDGCQLLQSLLNQPNALGKATPPGLSRGLRSREVQCMLGTFTLTRAYYLTGDGQRHFPMDEALGLDERYTPGARKLAVYAGAMDGSFDEGEAALRVLAGLDIPASQIRRVSERTAPVLRQWQNQQPVDSPAPIPAFYVGVDGTGVPVRRSQTRGRRGKSPDGIARTREVKLGCLFTRHSLDEKGHPIRDPDKTWYRASFQKADAFGTILLEEARRRGIASATEVVVLGDGAHWIWNLARINFPSAVQILDLYHACEHLGTLAEAVFPDMRRQKQARSRWKRWIEADRLDRVLAEAKTLLPSSGERRRIARKELAYFRRNASRMRYRTFRRRHWFVGSGVVEAGCKAVVGKRTKQSGMHWNVSGAQDILDIRCNILSRDFDAFCSSALQRAA